MLYRTPLATLNLLSSPTRAVVWVAGVTFALLLIFVQLGFRGAVANTATIVYSRLRFDGLLRSPEYLHLYETRIISRTWLDLVASHPDVERVWPFQIMLNRWQSPTDMRNRGIALMGMERDKPVLDVPEIDKQLNLLGNPDWVLIDRASRPDFGPADGVRFGQADIGRTAELGQQKTKIAGTFYLGTGLATNGAVLISDVGFAKRSGIDASRDVHLGLIQLKPGRHPERTFADIRQYLNRRDNRAADAVELLSRRETMAWEQHHWLRETPIGIIFQMGVALSLIVGSAIVYMVLASDVANRLQEYATLKAMGYSQIGVSLVVLRQAWMLAILGYIPALAIAEALYRITEYFAAVPIFMTLPRAIGILLLSFAMCSVSGLLAIRKLGKASPADLF